VVNVHKWGSREGDGGRGGGREGVWDGEEGGRGGTLEMGKKMGRGIVALPISQRQSLEPHQ
jgi:hypothetical protein